MDAVLGTTGLSAVMGAIGLSAVMGAMGLSAHLTHLHAHAMPLETARGQLRRGRTAQYGAGRARIGAAHHNAVAARGLDFCIERRIEHIRPREELRGPTKRRIERVCSLFSPAIVTALVVVHLFLGVPAGSGRT